MDGMTQDGAAVEVVLPANVRMGTVRDADTGERYVTVATEGEAYAIARALMGAIGIVLPPTVAEYEAGDEAASAARHTWVRCEQGDCGEEFYYCEDANHYCPACGESGEGAADC